ncbi:hypothetical protein ACVWZ8_001212 [Arthrobacter sp. UYCu723]
MTSMMTPPLNISAVPRLTWPQGSNLALGPPVALVLYSGNSLPRRCRLNGPTLGLLGGGAACFALAVLLPGRDGREASEDGSDGRVGRTIATPAF